MDFEDFTSAVIVLAGLLGTLSSLFLFYYLALDLKFVFWESKLTVTLGLLAFGGKLPLSNAFYWLFFLLIAYFSYF